QRDRGFTLRNPRIFLQPIRPGKGAESDKDIPQFLNVIDFPLVDPLPMTFLCSLKGRTLPPFRDFIFLPAPPRKN
ncbi:MAG: hypothetical protein ACE5I8_10405, partial [Thermodesulfobacteriota bacterium]